MLTVCIGALLAVTGCQGLREMIHSRSYHAARRLQQEKRDLVAKNATLQGRLLASTTQQKLAQQEAEILRKDLASRGKGTATPSTAEAVRPAAELRWERLTEALRGLGAPMITEKGGRGIRLSGDILFRSGKCDVNGGGKKVLGRVATVIKDLDDGVVVFVDGHTDSDPLRYTKGLYGDLYGLASARANAVARELVASGVARRQLITRSFGADYPIASNKTTAGKKRNRRVDMIFGFSDSVRVSRRAEP